ncbi:hypothetical protein BDB00DRAFT_876220 [Zychaea mexicana]|uniref:uncharacterized protein n=1 Tax=Zychaea mexicana TaxID=64656 RepID=UPI0022FF3EE7|nr:uncharacterized protein BDB00DRAFT_876220 [Zychaea mexicana]KAI9489560.1 hypothetical protein BDB00DRAFT_876220 [Zychaea mexicana]
MAYGATAAENGLLDNRRAAKPQRKRSRQDKRYRNKYHWVSPRPVSLDFGLDAFTAGAHPMSLLSATNGKLARRYWSEQKTKAAERFVPVRINDYWYIMILPVMYCERKRRPPPLHRALNQDQLNK